jgi:hypothetical protein
VWELICGPRPAREEGKRKDAGSQFCPRCVAALTRLLDAERSSEPVAPSPLAAAA